MDLTGVSIVNVSWDGFIGVPDGGASAVGGVGALNLHAPASFLSDTTCLYPCTVHFSVMFSYRCRMW